MSTVTVSGLPGGDAETDIIVPGVQDGTLKQHTFPPSVFYPAASKEAVRDMASTTQLVTPASLTAVINPIRDILSNFWSSWTTAVTATTTAKGGNLNFDADATEVSAAADIPASPAAGDLIIVDTTFTDSGTTYNADSMYEWDGTDSWDVVTPLNTLTTGQDARTQNLGTTRIAAFYDTATGVPVIQGDTLRMGLVTLNDDNQRLAIAEFVSAGSTVWKIVANAWQRITDESDEDLLQEAIGIRVGAGWYLTPLQGRESPTTSPERYWLIKRDTANLEAYSIDYSAGDSTGATEVAAAADLPASPAADDTIHVTTAFTHNSISYVANSIYEWDGSAWKLIAPTYDLYKTTRTFSNVAATVTAATIKSALEGLSGNARVDKSAIKNLTESTPDFGFHCVGGSDEMPTAAVGDVIFAYQDFTHANLGDSDYAFTRGVFYKYSAAVNSDPMGWQPLNASNAIYNAPGIPASALDSEQFAPDRLATGGSANKVLAWKDASTMEWRSREPWEQIALEVPSENPDSGNGIREIAVNLISGKRFSDYSELYFWGKGTVSSVMVPQVLFATTTETKYINMPFGEGNANGEAHIYRVDDDSYKFIAIGSPLVDNNGGLHGIWGKK